MQHNSLEIYASKEALRKLEDCIYENKLLDPFIQYLRGLNQFPNFMQLIYDGKVPINEKGEVTIDTTINEEVTGRLFYNIAVEIESGKHIVQEIMPSEVERYKNKINSKYEYIVVPEFGPLNKEFEGLFIEILDRNNDSSLKKKKEKNKKNKDIYEGSRYDKKEDEIIERILMDVFQRVCESYKVVNDNNEWMQFIAELENTKFQGDLEKMTKYLLNCIQFVIAAHIKNAYVEKFLSAELEKNKVDRYKSKPKTKQRSESSSSSTSITSASSHSNEQTIKKSSWLSQSTSSVLGTTSREKSLSISPQSQYGKFFSSSDSGSTTSTTSSVSSVTSPRKNSNGNY